MDQRRATGIAFVLWHALDEEDVARSPGAPSANLLAAMLTVTLVATLATAALWQQWRAVEIEAADRSRVQAGWILTGAMDWSRLILREDAEIQAFARKAFEKQGIKILTGAKVTKLDLTKDIYAERMNKIDTAGRPVRGSIR